MVPPDTHKGQRASAVLGIATSTGVGLSRDILIGLYDLGVGEGN